ncbi:serine hydrolase [Kangiella sp. HZ709]|uniref:serine hydrolase domain-containing protein n=1 Tax=Kangiella sp. HZ709 TaxID=2666328 RepID=UPI0012B136FF|nr:serine hydrolase domain-containing protein [Kangiella sp. HZ709]MRX28047.1 serine hydrolase [Kangiella sp. HZ709]
MKRKLLSILLVTTLSSVSYADGSLSTESSDKQSSVSTITNNYKQLDQYFEVLAEKERVLGSFAIYQNGKNIYSKNYLAVDGKVKEEELGHRYKIGSITKTFTATLVLQLIEEGKLTLDTKLAKFFPEIKNADKITIEMMLNHHSGIFNYTNHEEFLSYYQQTQSNKEMVERIKTYEPVFEPGERGEYSNSNYLLLGYILEVITGKDYGVLVAEKIAKPLNLKATYLEEKTEPENNEVFSYQKSGSLVATEQWNMSTADAAGAIVSTTHDLNLFFKGLFDGKLISKELLNKMIEVTDTYGYGIFKRTIEIDDKEYVGYWHNGRIERFSSGMMYFPEQKIGVASLLNADLYDGSKIFRSMTNAAFGKEIAIPEFKVIKLTEKELQQYVGDYSSDTHPLGIKVMVEDKQLKAQADGQGAFPLTGIDKDKFEFSAAGIEIEFDPSSKQFVIKQGGRADIFVEKSKKRSEKNFNVPEDTLKLYVGVYKSDDFPLDIEVFIKDEKFQAQATGQPAFPLTAVSETEFKFKLAGISIKFDAEKNQLAITQHGNTNIMTKE